MTEQEFISQIRELNRQLHELNSPIIDQINSLKNKRAKLNIKRYEIYMELCKSRENASNIQNMLHELGLKLGIRKQEAEEDLNRKMDIGVVFRKLKSNAQEEKEPLRQMLRKNQEIVFELREQYNQCTNEIHYVKVKMEELQEQRRKNSERLNGQKSELIDKHPEFLVNQKNKIWI